jgi:hypothetical protein
MYFLLSGEGPTDIGLCANGAQNCDGPEHEEGPMAMIVSQIVEGRLGFSFLESGYYGFVSKSTLVSKASKFKAHKKSLRLPGQKKAKETAYFYRNARALALCALEKEAKLTQDVVAVLFRDSDGTASASRGLWTDKRDSMLQGFDDENYARGVPMIPKPKSEGWIICAVKRNPYQACEALEDRSGNDDSPNSLKKELVEILKGHTSREELRELVTTRKIDFNRIDMPSFNEFRIRLEEVI